MVHDLESTTLSVKHGGGCVMARACLAVSGIGTLVFNDDVAADSGSRMNCEVGGAIISAQI